jgi:hypothetical protein
LRRRLAHHPQPRLRIGAHLKQLRPELANWATIIQSGQLDALTEREILPDFLTLFFGELLGYTGPADSPGRYKLSRENTLAPRGRVILRPGQLPDQPYWQVPA